MRYQLTIRVLGILLIGLSVFLLTANAAPGDLDAAFSSDGKSIEIFGGGGVNSLISAAIQPDGKMIAVGRVSLGTSEYCGIVRYNTDGSLDSAFDDDGKIFIQIGGPTRCNAVAVQADGKIVAAGYVTISSSQRIAVIRLNPNGSLDSSFDGDGKLTTDVSGAAIANAVAIQTDGKIVVVGYSQAGFAAARFNPDGSLDTSFDGDGKVTVSFLLNSQAKAVVIQTDGKIVLAGSTYNGSTFDFALARFNTNGSLDPSFDGDGKLITDLSLEEATSVAVQADGKIVAAGGTTSNGNSNFALARYHPNGSLDTTFDGDGIVITDFLGTGDYIQSIAIQADGKIVAAGDRSFEDGLLARYNADGSLDTSFDGDGKLITDFGGLEYARVVVIQTDGKIVTAGNSTPTDSNYLFTLVRYTATGSLDTSYGDGGITRNYTGGGISSAQSVAIQADGKIVAAGYNGSGLSADIALVRYTATGALDTSFDGDGKLITDFFGKGDHAYSVAVQTDGKIVVAGDASNGVTGFFALARYNSDGSPDPSFDGDGKLTTAVLSDSSAFAMAIQPDGKIIAAGYAYNGADTDFALVRYNPNGSLDASLDGDGIVTTSFSGFDEIYALTVQTDGKIVVTGSTYNGASYDFALARFNLNGLLDTSFDGDGKLTTPIISSRQGANAVVIQTDGKIVVAGNTNLNGTTQDDIALVRYNSNGSLDASFDGDGILATNTAAADFANALAIQTDGKIIVGGSVSGSFALIRYNPNGSLDGSYGTDGKAVFNLSGSNTDRIFGLALDSHGRTVVAGEAGGLFAVARVLGDFTSFGAPYDFDGDGKTDISIYRPSSGQWWINNSSTSATIAAQFGASTDKIVPGDFSGDGKADIALFRPSSGEWFILRSENSSFYSVPFGASGDVPVPADYDGDGKSDVAVFRPSDLTWYISKSSGGTLITTFGTIGDVPVTGDYDGDDKADVAIYRPSTGEWWISRSATSSTVVFQFGNSTDTPVQGDFTGDGKTDIALFRASTGFWFIMRSEDNSFYSVPFGANGDTPTPGDYDGDGKFDTAVFRPSDSTWYINRSTSGLLIAAFGVTGDKPVPSAFLP